MYSMESDEQGQHTEEVRLKAPEQGQHTEEVRVKMPIV